jgi:hypothetical protein
MGDEGHGGPLPATAVPPDHLVVWLRGTGEDAEPPVLLDEELDRTGFSQIEWLARVREGYPDAIPCIVHDRREATADWLSHIDRLVSAVRLAESRFTGDTLPTEPARLRRWVRATLAEHQASADGAAPAVRVEDAVLVADELVNNAGEHAAGWVTVDLLARPDGVMVAVSDPNPDDPAVLREAPPEEISGRGLLVVSALCPTWGVLASRTMKTVWAWLPSEATTSDGSTDLAAAP